jgi:demethylmenaquinone methyltransferase / 2-methoxy-6-polyprenyl-1,4-benzoquinol methylase
MSDMSRAGRAWGAGGRGEGRWGSKRRTVGGMPDVNRFTRELFTPLPSQYDRLAEVLSFGQNGQWRREMVSRIVAGHTPGGVYEAGGAQQRRVLDVASGTAGVAIALARGLPDATIVGVDLTEAMLRTGRANLDAAHTNGQVQLVTGRAEELPFPDASFDALTFTYLLRYVDDPQATLSELARVMKPGATMASLEFCVPPSAWWRWWWTGYTRMVLPVAGLATGGPAWWRVGRFLGPSISGHYRRYPVDWTVKAWESAGFENVGTRVMSLGGGLVMWGTRGDG